MVHIGDKVVSIDSINVTSCTAGDARQILANTGSVVKLKLLESFTGTLPAYLGNKFT